MTPTATKPMTLVERARAILDGVLIPEPLRLPAEVQEEFEREVARWDPPGTPEAVIFHRNSWIMQTLFAGTPVMRMTLPDGTLVILAAGEDEILELIPTLRREDRRRVVFDATY